MANLKFHAAWRRSGLILGVLVTLLAATPGFTQDLASFEQKTTTHVLDNGWTFIIVERPVAPVFSFTTYANVGAAQEVPGITGLAHMFEHMAFKGTPNIGTKDYKSEKRAIEELEAAYQAWQDERLSRNPDQERLAQLSARFEEKQKAADQYVVNNEFGDILSREGGTGLNAFTNSDVTGYFYSLPANKLELMAFLESERFMHPVFREFYKERDVVMEERRMRTESSPIGRLVEEFLAAAYLAHPYGQPTVGHRSDLQSFTREDALDFYDKYYVPSNVVMCLVGDVDPQRVRQLAEKYFGDWKREPTPEPVRTVEPPQKGERRVVVRDPGQPFYIIGYHKPAATDPDDAAYDVLVELLANGRSSRIHKRLVKEEKKAVAVGALTQFPGLLYPGLLVAFTRLARTRARLR
ncbi:MAG: M16 family metallopeptidase, partial [Acidobacteriota bacterium]